MVILPINPQKRTLDYFNLPVSIFTPQLGNDTNARQKDNYFLGVLLQAEVGKFPQNNRQLLLRHSLNQI